jgi:hypothetical protein
MYCGVWVRKGVEISPSYTAGKMLARDARHEFYIVNSAFSDGRKSSILDEYSPKITGFDELSQQLRR